MASFLPRRARRCGCGWLISITPQPRSTSDRAKAAPKDPVDSTPTAAIDPERREPHVSQAVTGAGRRERLGAQDPAQRVERGDDMEIGVAVNPTYHRLVLTWHADVLHLGAARVPGRDGHNSDEESVSAGS